MHPAAHPHPVSPRACTLLVCPNSAASGSNYSHSTREVHARARPRDGDALRGGPGAAAKKVKGGRSNTIPGLEPLSPEHKPPKIPVRSLTGLSHVMFAEPTKGKECIWCEAVIEDGRWIQTDAGGARGAGRI
ncbi:hypothetical protein FIBSPDRAFT_1038744 [Athelia psychrophila]|uniref:Uncharacterized protein n=1 Tax=Athelia psychrophila TaxID=1759441 RepID=A0A166SQV3_9AGAM|nr:hypothetical protein FIBSPDRAFT_1038744 [Fibularhizoctonia sp. CBS 109695]